MTALSIQNMRQTLVKREISVSDSDREDSGLDGDPRSETGKANLAWAMKTRIDNQNRLMYESTALEEGCTCSDLAQTGLEHGAPLCPYCEIVSTYEPIIF